MRVFFLRDTVDDQLFNTPGITYFERETSRGPGRKQSHKPPALSLILALTMTATGLLSFSCASTVAVLHITAPATATVGSPFTVTVYVTADGRPDTIFNSPIHFTSSDTAAVLPVDYAFTAADAGSHTFTNVTLMTAGSQTISATDPNAPSITATATVVTAAER